MSAEQQNDLRKLRKIIGVGAVRSLQSGALLRIWRRSTPHNWWINSKQGKLVWHSEGRNYPDLRMFERVGDSRERIMTGSWLAGSDEGRPEESVYRLARRYCR